MARGRNTGEVRLVYAISSTLDGGSLVGLNLLNLKGIEGS